LNHLAQPLPILPHPSRWSSQLDFGVYEFVELENDWILITFYAISITLLESQFGLIRKQNETKSNFKDYTTKKEDNKNQVPSLWLPPMKKLPFQTQSNNSRMK